MAKIFVSSVFNGMEEFRAAAAEAIESLGHTALLAENFPASSTSPRIACLAGVREADAVVLLLGERYGPKQNMDLSATHEEYREAKERCIVIPFVQANVELEEEQQQFVNEVRSWSGGHYTMPFDSPEGLRKAATIALHRWELSQTAGTPNSAEILAQALALLPSERQSYGSSSFALALTGWPVQQVLRPSELEGKELRKKILNESLFVNTEILSSEDGTEISLKDHRLVFKQRRSYFWIDGQGSIVQHLPVQMPDVGMSMLIEENMQDQLVKSLRFAAWVLDQIDPRERLSHVAFVAALNDVGHLGWRTRREQEASPNSGTMSMVSRPPVAHLSPPYRTRAALRLETATLAEDLVTLLRRAVKGS